MRRALIAVLAAFTLDTIVGGTPGAIVAQRAVADPILPGQVVFGADFDAHTGVIDGGASSFGPESHLYWAARFRRPIGHATLVRFITRETRAARSVLLASAPIAVDSPVDGVWEDHPLTVWRRVLNAGAGTYTIRYVWRGAVLARGSFTLS